MIFSPLGVPLFKKRPFLFLFSKKIQKKITITPPLNLGLYKALHFSNMSDTTNYYKKCIENNIVYDKEEDFWANRDNFNWEKEYQLWDEDRKKRDECIQSILKGENMFITGGAGVGKTHLLNRIIDELERSHPEKIFSVTSTTGTAASRIKNASTIHSWAGFGLGTMSIQSMINIINSFKKIELKEQWKSVDILFIDEISMMDPEFLGKLESFAKTIRMSQKPFGGIQIVAVGDFFQLPPISREKEDKKYTYCFEIPFWKEHMKKNTILTYSHRQKADAIFFSVLNRMRIGESTQDDFIVLSKYIIKKEDKEYLTGDLPIIYPVTRNVDLVNENRLKSLTTKERNYEMIVKTTNIPITAKEDLITSNLKCTNLKRSLKIKVGCRVILLKNISIPKGLVNGAIGKVTGYNDNHVMVRFDHMDDDESIKISRCSCLRQDQKKTWSMEFKQFPLALYYASTTHKSQGGTIMDGIIDLGPDNFGFHQIYTGISRFPSLERVKIISFDPTQISIDPKVKRFYSSIGEQVDTPYEFCKEEEFDIFIDKVRKEKTKANTEIRELPQYSKNPNFFPETKKAKLEMGTE